jgi:cytoskeletal protein CcmA (bactofilin family)
VACEKKIVLGETGRIEGTLKANEAVIMGYIKGELRIDGVLHLSSTAHIEGDIYAKKIIVEEGARYSGACKIG